MKKSTIHVVPHTHWDREWYFTQSRANTLFAHNMKEIIDVLNHNHQFKNFVLDGQVSVLNDYLIDHHQNYEEIKKLAIDNKLLLGPWYSQPDMFNSTGESIIRNLEYGINIANSFNKTMTTAYLPDSFGFNINLPQIFNYFGLKNMVFWRGMKKEDNDKTLYFNWKGADGSQIPAYCFQHGYWVFGGVFPYGKITTLNYQEKTQQILKDLKPFLKTIKERSHNELNNQILLPFGGDEGPIVDELTIVIDELNKIDPDNEWVMSNFNDFFSSVEKPNYEIDSSLHWPYLARIHRTISSSRYDIKALFRQCENKLYYELEPLSIIYKQFDNQYNNQTVIDNVMKKILVSQAHDSLGTCNSDLTNQDISNRLTSALEIIKMEIAIIKKKIFTKLELVVDEDILCFNLSPYARSITMSTKINSFKSMITSQDKKFVLQITDSKKLQTTLEYKDYYCHFVSLKTPIMKPTSYQVFKVLHSNVNKKQNNNFTNIVGDPDNHIWVHRDQFTFINTKLSLDDFINILPYDDAGDSYDFSPKTIDNKTTKIASINKITQNITTLLYHVIELDHIVTYKNNLKQVFKIKLRKWYNDIYRLKISADNKSINTKWVINFNFKENFQLSDVAATQSLALVKRIDFVEKDWKAKGYKEFPCPITTNDNAIKIPQFDNFTLLTKGNNEFEVVDQGLQVSLFRTYGFIGNKDLIWRPGRPSGVHISTPDAELQKQLEFNFGFLFGSDNTASLINDWNFNSDIYYGNNPDDLDFYADRFVINYDHQKPSLDFKLPEITIQKEFLISSFRIVKNNLYQLRIANIQKDSQNFELKINNKKINFAIQKQFKDNIDNFNYQNVEVKSQKFITIYFCI